MSSSTIPAGPTSYSPTDTIATITDPIATPTYGSKGVFTVHARAVIKGTASAVFNALQDVDSYLQWNSYVPEVEIISEPRPREPTVTTAEFQLGTVMNFEIYTNGNGLSSDTKRGEPGKHTYEITVLEELKDGRKGYRLAWKEIRLSNWAMTAEWIHEIIEKEDRTTEYITWETFGGPMAYGSKLLVRKQLLQLFNGWAKDVKNYVESLGKVDDSEKAEKVEKVEEEPAVSTAGTVTEPLIV